MDPKSIVYSDLELPLIGLGTYQLFGDDIKNTVKNALEIGYRHFDTANLYKTEQGLGEAISECINENKITRQEIFITTKVSFNHLKKKQVRKGVENSFEKLGLEYIDLILLHMPLHHLENWKELEEIYMEYRGRIRFIGVSNFSIQHLTEIMQIGTFKPFCNQIEVSPFFVRDKLAQFCFSNEIKIIAHSSLVRGEKFTNNEKMQQLCSQLNCTQAQILLKWAINKGYYIIPKACTEVWLRENFASDLIKLNSNTMEYLNQLNERFTLYPKFVYDEDK